MFQLPNLPYHYSDLEPFIDARTLEIHYSKHHQAYVTKLNEVLAHNPEFLKMSVQELLTSIDQVPQEIRPAVINNGGQHYNHSLYWESMSPTGGEISPELTAALEDAFGSIETFKETFTNAGITQFGSGWAWLSVNKEGTLEVEKTPNGDTPLMSGKQPILTMDVWEHAYYLHYQNRRPEYIQAWWNIVNWQGVSEKYRLAKNN